MQYHKYGGLSHAKIAKILCISTSLSHRIETDTMLKFALAIFNPPWSIKNNRLRSLRDKNRESVRFGEIGCYFNDLAEKVRRWSTESDFKTNFEKQIIIAANSIEFRKYVMQVYQEHVNG
ncbi:hypothetical protein HYV49_05310 [Candidatus Pacearchaeota archaeon]|nr:hypothetical protein [Candidatus Pacearchaeota archaeon]